MKLNAKRVLVTGADGFVGSHLVDLRAAGASGRCGPWFNTIPSIRGDGSRSCPIAQDVEVVSGDIRDPHFCLSLIRGIDIVFHLAALIPIPYSYAAPDSYLDTNVERYLEFVPGGTNPTASRNSSIPQPVKSMGALNMFQSTSGIPWCLSPHTAPPRSPAMRSLSASSIRSSCLSSFARPFNTYGPRQSARAVIPTIISQLAAGHREVRLGDLTTSRDFTFVEDTCRGFAAIAALDGGLGEVFNIGSNSEVTVDELFQLITAAMGIVGASPLRRGATRPTARQRSATTVLRQQQTRGCERLPSAGATRRRPGADGRLVPGPAQPPPIQDQSLQCLSVRLSSPGATERGCDRTPWSCRNR